jgi:hypothetical protein
MRIVPQKQVLSLLQERLETFELTLEAGVVATTRDGAMLLEKFGTLSPTIQQLCDNHALHIAVTEVFCVKSER